MLDRIPPYEYIPVDIYRAFLYYGSASGLSTAAGWTKDGATVSTNVSGAGDVNQDGYSDVIIGAPAYSNGQAGEGIASVYLGSSS